MVDSVAVTPGVNATATQYNNLRSDLLLGKRQQGTDADAVTVTIDLSDITKGNVRKTTLGGNRTLAISNPTAGQAFVYELIQDATGSRTVTWWAGIKWQNGVVPTLSTAANAIDIFVFLYDGTTYFGSIYGQAFA